MLITAVRYNRPPSPPILFISTIVSSHCRWQLPLPRRPCTVVLALQLAPVASCYLAAVAKHRVPVLVRLLVARRQSRPSYLPLANRCLQLPPTVARQESPGADPMADFLAGLPDGPAEEEEEEVSEDEEIVRPFPCRWILRPRCRCFRCS